MSVRYSGGPATLDLSPWLDEQASVVVQKDIHAQMGITTIECADQAERRAGQSLYHMLEPMDHVTIRMARDPHKYGGTPPVIMRGFVTSVNRSETMMENGVPARRVSIVVADYTKLFHNVQLFYLPNNPLMALNWPFLFDLVYGNGKPRYGKASELVHAVVDAINANYIPLLSDGIVKFIERVVDVVEGTTNPLAWQPYQGTLWNLLLTYTDRPWNEIFIRDYDDGPKLIYRPAPFYDPYTGQIISFGEDRYTTINEFVTHVESRDIVSLNLSRTDADLANVFWVDPAPLMVMADPKFWQDDVAPGDPTVEMTGYQNNDPDLYGKRLMRATTMHGPTEYAGVAAGRPAEGDDGHYAYTTASAPWITKKRIWLRDTAKDNVVLETGTAVVKGNEGILAGTYCWLNRGIPGRYYVTGVVHRYLPFRSYTTSMQMMRGEGFLQASRTVSAPYWHEHRNGVYG